MEVRLVPASVWCCRSCPCCRLVAPTQLLLGPHFQQCAMNTNSTPTCGASILFTCILFHMHNHVFTFIHVHAARCRTGSGRWSNATSGCCRRGWSRSQGATWSATGRGQSTKGCSPASTTLRMTRNATFAPFRLVSQTSIRRLEILVTSYTVLPGPAQLALFKSLAEQLVLHVSSWVPYRPSLQ